MHHIFLAVLQIVVGVAMWIGGILSVVFGIWIFYLGLASSELSVVNPDINIFMIYGLVIFLLAAIFLAVGSIGSSSTSFEIRDARTALSNSIESQTRKVAELQGDFRELLTMVSEMQQNLRDLADLKIPRAPSEFD